MGRGRDDEVMIDITDEKRWWGHLVWKIWLTSSWKKYVQDQGTCVWDVVCQLFLSVSDGVTSSVDTTNNDIILLHTQADDFLRQLSGIWEQRLISKEREFLWENKTHLSFIPYRWSLSWSFKERNTNYIFQPTFFVQVYPFLLLSSLTTFHEVRMEPRVMTT